MAKAPKKAKVTRMQTRKKVSDAAVSVKPGRERKRGSEIAHQLRKQIIRGELADGSHLPPEAELMKELEISRPTLREALRILESESLITVRRGSRVGPMVHLPDPGIVAHHVGLYLQTHDTTLQDAHEARMLIEPGAIRLLIETGNDSAAEVLEEIVEKEIIALQRKDAARLGQLVSHFHRSLILLTDSPTLSLLMGVLDSIYEKQIAFMAQAYKLAPDSADQALAAQRKLIKLIKAGKTVEAVSHWRNQLEDEINWFRARAHAERVIDVLTE